eukprot:1619750-Prymnesium_polylepis.1
MDACVELYDLAVDPALLKAGLPVGMRMRQEEGSLRINLRRGSASPGPGRDRSALGGGAWVVRRTAVHPAPTTGLRFGWGSWYRKSKAFAFGSMDGECQFCLPYVRVAGVTAVSRPRVCVRYVARIHSL